jgi:hypothetical protein
LFLWRIEQKASSTVWWKPTKTSKLFSLLGIGKCQFAGKMVQKVNKSFNFESVKTDKILSYGGWDAEANRDIRLSTLNKSIV